MKHYTPSFTRRNVRAVFASLLSYLLLAGQMAPLVLAATSTAPRVAPPTDVARESAGEAPQLQAVAAPAPLAAPAALVPMITATKTDSFTDIGGDGKADPGQTITYTITINNTGPGATDAANVTLTDMVDPNTTIVPGSAVASPIALDENYNVLGNVRIQPNAASGLLANEKNPNTGDNSGLTVSGPTTSANNGNVTVNADGSFSYNPPPGFTGPDSFTYTVTSANGSDTATARFNVGDGTATPAVANDPVIWFIDDNAAVGGDGRLTNPFNCVVGAGCFDTVAADQAGDNIFVYAGTYNDTGALTLLNNQRVIGQGASTTLAAIAGVTVPANSDALPTLTSDPSTVVINSTASGIVVTTGNTNTLRGFTLGNNGPGAKIFSTAFTTLTVSEVALSGTGTALNLDSGALNATFTSIVSTSAAGQGIALDQITGTLTATGGTSVTDPATQCILVTASTANMSFGNTTCSDATDGISLGNNSAGTRTFGTLSVTNGTGAAFFHNNGGGTTNITGATTITNPGGKGIDIQDSTTAVTFANTTVNGSAGTGVELGGAGDANSGAVTFADLDIAPDANVRAFQAVDNTGQITTTSGTISNTSTATTFEIDGPAGRTPLSMVLNSISSDGGANGIIIMDASGTFTNGATSLLNNGGIGLLVANSTATFGFGNTTVNSSAGDGVDLSNNTGAITFADLDIAPDANLRGLDAANNSGTITTTSGDIATTGAPAVFIDGPAGRTPLAVVLNNVDSTNSGTTGVEIREVSGSFTVNDATLATNIVNPTGVGLSLINNTAAFNFANTNVSGSGGTGVVLGTAGNGNTGAITFADLDIAPDSGQRGLHGVDNSGTITTTTGTLNAPNSAAVEITRSSSTTPLNVTFLSVSADGGGLSGIVLTNTSGSFTVTGDAAAANNGSGGSISNKVGAGNLAGVALTNVTNVRLRRMNLNNNDGSGVFGTTVNGFELTRCNVNNNGDQAAPDESGVELLNLTGTNSGGANPTSITNNSINNNFEAQLQVTNTTGTLTSLDMSGNTITDNGTTGVTANLMTFAVPVGGNSPMTLNLTSGTFTGAAPNTASGIQCDHSGTGGLLTCNVSGATFTNNNVAIESGVANAGNNNFIIQNNTATGNRSHALNFFANASSTGTVNGKFLNNIVGTSGSVGSGSSIGNGIRVQNESQNNTGAANILVSGNTVQEIATQTAVIVNQGIAGGGDPDSKPTNVTITNNVIRDVDDSRAIVVSYNDTDAGANGQTCADISGNEMNNISGLSNAPAPGGDGTKIRVAGLTGGTFRVRQTSAADLAAQNSPPVGVAVTTTTAAQISVRNPVTFNGGVCTQPTNAPIEFTENFVPRRGTTIGGNPTIGGVVVAPTSEDGNVTSRPFVSPMRLVKTQAAQPVVQQQRAAAAAKAASLQTKGAAAKGDTAKGEATTQVKRDAPASKKPTGTNANDTPTPNPPVVMGDTLTWNVGTLPAGASVTITFQVVVDNPFNGGLPQVSNQGTISADGISNVLTDDPSEPGASDPTVTPILATNVIARDGKAPEPPSGQAPLLFTIALSTPATGAITVNYSTADGGATPATGGAACGGSVDYVSVTGGAVMFATGEQLRTVSVDICSDGSAEPDETFLLNLTGATGATIIDNQATGTITAANPAGTTLISELRTFGPGSSNDPNDDFVEIYNNSDSPVTVAASDASAGWAVYSTSSGCNSAPLLLGTIPNGTVIPARGHFLLTGSAYSLANYGGTGAAAGNLTMAADLASNANVAVFSTSDVTNLSTVTRLDAVGFNANTGGAICDLLREGTTATGPTTNMDMLGQYSVLRDPCGKAGSITVGGLCPTTGNPSDSNVNGTDFFVVDPNGAGTGGQQRIGAAGPENIASPVRRDATISVVPFDISQAPANPPNRIRDFDSDPGNNATFGTLSIRRRFVNNTGAPVTRLRFRVVDISTFGPVPSDVADLRALSTPTADLVTSVMINDAATCAAETPSVPAPCMATLRGTTLEEPPSQPEGGGFNSTLSAGTVTVGTPLAPGASINLQFLLGIEQTGSFKFYFIIEALP